MEKFRKLVKACLAQEISDLHLAGGHPVVCRRHGQLFVQKDMVFSPQEVDLLVGTLLNPRQKGVLRTRWSVDLALSLQGARLRLNIFSTLRGLSLAVRFLPGKVPSLEQLNLLPDLKELAALRSGLVLFCGATGSGKTTTIAALIGEINRTRAAHIVTLEDPVEYRMPSLRSFVEQREHGVHFPTYEQGLLDVLRQAPDVIVVGELRKAETIRLTLNAAESGHLVFATLHAATAEESGYRMCNAFSPESQEFVRFQLSTCLAAVVVQQLVFLERQGFRVPLLSVAKGTPALRSLIRENRLTQVESALETNKAQGMFTFARYRTEFLDQKPVFTPPSVCFRPSPETAPEPTHLSPLIDYDAGLPSHPLVPAAASRPDADGGGILDVTEEADLEDLIASYEKRAPGMG